MTRKVNGHFADSNSTRDILGITPREFALMITALQKYYIRDATSFEEELIEKILSEINKPYPGATY
jgi:hypothetical protein